MIFVISCSISYTFKRTSSLGVNDEGHGLYVDINVMDI